MGKTLRDRVARYLVYRQERAESRDAEGIHAIRGLVDHIYDRLDRRERRERQTRMNMKLDDTLLIQDLDLAAETLLTGLDRPVALTAEEAMTHGQTCQAAASRLATLANVSNEAAQDRTAGEA